MRVGDSENNRYIADEDLPRNWELPSEVEIVAGWKGDLSSPVVSICCNSFNHAPFIEDALNGVLSQKTDFPFEIIVRDDASTDGTTEIIQKYSKKYPNIIRHVRNERNRFKDGERAMHIWPSLAKGKYVALTATDDFWITTDKLQRQFELLERFHDSPVCVAKSHIYKQNEAGRLRYLSTTNVPDKNLLYFGDVHSCYVHPSTYMIRTPIFNEIVNKFFKGHCLFGDTALRAIMVSYGPFVLLNQVVSVYRITGEGIWSSLGRVKQIEWEYDAGKKLSEMLEGKHASYQRNRLFMFALRALKANLAARNYKKSCIWFGVTFKYFLLKIPSYINNKTRRLITN